MNRVEAANAVRDAVNRHASANGLSPIGYVESSRTIELITNILDGGFGNEFSDEAVEAMCEEYIFMA